MNKWWLIILAVLITAGLIEVAIVVPQDYKNHTGMFTPARAQKTAVIATEATTVEETLTEAETEPETAEIEVEDEQEASEEDSETVQSTASEMVEKEGSVQLLVPSYKERSEVETEGESLYGDDRTTYYGIWSGEYWHFTPEQIDHRWNGMKSSKPDLPEGTTRAWQRYLYDKLVSIGAEHFYKIAVAQAMQESGFNPLNQQGNNSVPDKGLYSFRVYYWNPSYGDIYDYRANIDAYVSRIAPYLNDRSEQGIYLALSQHYNPTGQIHMEYVNHVLGRLNELWEME